MKLQAPDASTKDKDYRMEMVDDRMAEMLRTKTPTERLAIGFGLWESSRSFLQAHLRAAHPDWSETELQNEIARRFLSGAA